MTRALRAEGLLWILGLAAAGVLFMQTETRAARPGGIDLTTYLEAARAAWAGANPYDVPAPFPYLYPLFLAVVLIPLTFAPEIVVRLAWFVVSLAALVWSVRETARAAHPQLQQRSLTPFLAVLFAATFPIIQNNVRNGQVNLLVLALCLYALAAHERRRTHRASLAMGTAVAIKMVPAILALFSLRRGEWRLALTSLLTAVLLCVVPLVLLNAELLSFQTQHLVGLVTGGFGNPVGVEPIEFSAGGMLVELFPAGPTGLLRLLGACIVGAAALAVDRGRRADASAFAVYLAAIPLASPKSEMHHLAFAIPAAAIVLAPYWFRLGRSETPPFWPSVAAACCYAMGVLYRPLAGVAICAALVMLGWATSRARN